MASEQVSQSESMTNGKRAKERESEGFKYVHNWALWNGQILQHIYITYIAVFYVVKAAYSSLAAIFIFGLSFSLLWKASSVFAALQ